MIRIVLEESDPFENVVVRLTVDVAHGAASSDVDKRVAAVVARLYAALGRTPPV